MENTPRLYDTLFEVLSQHRNWLDVRHLKTLAWMMIGLILSEKISLTEWAPYIQSRAEYAQSTVRRFRRWLDNRRIRVYKLYGPLIQQALSEWGENTLYLALDTSMLWGQYCIIRVSVIYRGRAIPLVWKVLNHPSSAVAFAVYTKTC
jgi:predicted HTH domain antitoxin